MHCQVKNAENGQRANREGSGVAKKKYQWWGEDSQGDATERRANKKEQDIEGKREEWEDKKTKSLNAAGMLTRCANRAL